jgi:RNA polymerase sigma-70 factor (ECF subfamily)
MAEEMKRLGRESDLAEFDFPDQIIERRLVLAELVNGLPHDQREVIIMRFAKDKSAREIARVLGRPNRCGQAASASGIEATREATRSQ